MAHATKNKLAVFFDLKLSYSCNASFRGVRGVHAMRPYQFSSIIAEFGTLSPSDTYARNLDIKLQSIVSCYPVCVIPGAAACLWFRFWCRCCLRVVYSTSTLLSLLLFVIDTVCLNVSLMLMFTTCDV